MAGDNGRHPPPVGGEPEPSRPERAEAAAAERQAVGGVPTIAALVDDHHEAVYRYAYRLTGSVPDAEDLAQHVFLTAQQKIGQLRRPDSPRAWLLTMVRNQFIKELKRRRPKAEADLRVDLSRQAEQELESPIDRERLQQVIDALPEPFRVVLLMFYFEETSYREMAEALDLPIGTIMSRLARAKSRMRNDLLAHDTDVYGDKIPQTVPADE